MLTIIEFITGIAVILTVVQYIINGYSVTGILFFGGIVLLGIGAIMGHKVLPIKAVSTGYYAIDIVEYIRILLMSYGGNLGMMIMTLYGFVTYMTHIGANDMIVKIASRPLKSINSPYILMVAAYFISCLISLAISSASGLGMMLMSTLFPLMVNFGISRGAAAAICASPVAIIISPTSGDIILAAKTAQMSLTNFTFKTTLPISIIAIIGMAITHYFWQRHLDNDVLFINNTLNSNKINKIVPNFYCILPFTPIIGIFVFDGKWGPYLHIITILILCVLITAILEYIRSCNIKKVLLDLEIVYKGMADAFISVVLLLVAAGVFSHGLNTIGFIQNIVTIAISLSSTKLIIMLVLAILTMLVAITTGSGNAPFYAFIEIIPKLMQSSGINPVYLSIPMLQASNLGRTISPFSVVIVTVAKIANISIFELIKRTLVPVIIGLIIVITATTILVPSYTI